MCNYKEKALYHKKNRLNDEWLIREKGNHLELIYFEEPTTIFPSWEKCYEYLKKISKSQKRNWLEKSKNFQNYIWDTDLETYEQELIKDIQEIYDYEYSSLDIAKLCEIIGDLTDEMLQKGIKDLIYALEYIYKKENIEIE